MSYHNASTRLASDDDNNVYVSELKFTISMDWPDADVDVVYKEMGAGASPHEVTEKTPTMESVDLFLDAVASDQPLKARGINMDEGTRLMMGTASTTFVLDPDQLSNLPELIRFAESRIRSLREEYVSYHQPGDTVSGTNVRVVSH